MRVPFLLAGLFVVLASTAAGAAPYFGLDLGAGSIDLKDSNSELTPQTTGGFGVHVGERFGNFAAELGYSTTSKSGNPNVNILHINRLTVDGIYAVPVMGALKLLVTGGGSETNYGSSRYAFAHYVSNGVEKYTRADVPLFHGDAFDWRAGGGFSIAFSDNFDVRIIGRYEPLKMGGLSRYALSLDSGFDFYF